MHEVPLLYRWTHKTHHKSVKNTGLMHATHFDILDLIIENSVAPYLIASVYALLGWPAQTHAVTSLILGVHDYHAHSISPYTVCFFNPWLDALFQSNVGHQLHHACHNDHYSVFPWERLTSRAKDTPNE